MLLADTPEYTTDLPDYYKLNIVLPMILFKRKREWTQLA
jgi:hypothetical protein